MLPSSAKFKLVELSKFSKYAGPKQDTNKDNNVVMTRKKFKSKTAKRMTKVQDD
jgi:hypothetical protein